MFATPESGVDATFIEAISHREIPTRTSVRNTKGSARLPPNDRRAVAGAAPEPRLRRSFPYGSRLARTFFHAVRNGVVPFFRGDSTKERCMRDDLFSTAGLGITPDSPLTIDRTD